MGHAMPSWLPGCTILPAENGGSPAAACLDLGVEYLHTASSLYVQQRETMAGRYLLQHALDSSLELISGLGIDF